ncbi:MAG: hypothetical protein OXF46_10840 [Rhodobacteraceae bacterium]|nr:hypothetical protein [Paracoccaceae bacterium]
MPKRKGKKLGSGGRSRSYYKKDGRYADEKSSLKDIIELFLNSLPILIGMIKFIVKIAAKQKKWS